MILKLDNGSTVKAEGGDLARLAGCTKAPTCGYRCRHEHMACGIEGPPSGNHRGYICTLHHGHHGPHIACVRSDLTGVLHALQEWR